MASARTIIHIDMDCFYAAIEVREHPHLRGKPVAVGGRSSQRGVLTTANYEARKFGCRSAMPAFKALRLCPHLTILPVRFELYRAESRRIREIFDCFTGLVEPLSLDEAYLDVSHLRSSGAYVAAEIRARIFEQSHLTASAGIAPNKFLAKVASDFNKPNGQFELAPADVEPFVRELPASRIWGVGERTSARLLALGVRTCGDLQRWSLPALTKEFGKFGVELYQLCRGQDDRPVTPDRERKSLSTERTYSEDVSDVAEAGEKLESILEELVADHANGHADRRIIKSFVKLKFSDFQSTTAECPARSIEAATYASLLREAWERRGERNVRLIGAGIRFAPAGMAEQLELNVEGPSAGSP
jgi:DNA polymerase-4